MASKRPMRISVEIPFAKYQAAGNDFIVTDFFAPLRGFAKWSGPELGNAGQAIGVDTPLIAQSICNRHTGVGADGWLLLLPRRDKRHTARMRVLNADGSEAEMSGNGIRCAAAYLLEAGSGPMESGRRGKAKRKPSPSRALRIETAAGVKSVEVVKAEEGRWVFRVGMGEPILAPEKIPFKAGDASPPGVNFPLSLHSGAVPVTVTSMGNPHCSVFVDDFNALDWLALGRQIENHELFPNRTNVEFVKVLSRDEIEVRFWERGVGQTQSSGTGSCAAVAASILNRLTGRKVRVRTLAGELEVGWPANGEVSLTGPVELVARGTYYWGYPGGSNQG
jgi:diaminopimelate epimerase